MAKKNFDLEIARANAADEYGAANTAYKTADSIKKDAASEIFRLLPSKTVEDQGYVFTGERFEVNISTVPVVEEVADLETLFKILGKKRFLEIAKVSVKDVKEILPKDKYEALLSSQRKGSRRLTCRVLED